MTPRTVKGGERKNLIAPFGRPKKNKTLRRFAPTDGPMPVDDDVIESLRIG